MGNGNGVYGNINNTLMEKLLPFLAPEMRGKNRSDRPWSDIRGSHRTPVKIARIRKTNVQRRVEVCSISCWRSANSRLDREFIDLAYGKRPRRTRMQIFKCYSSWSLLTYLIPFMQYSTWLQHIRHGNIPYLHRYCHSYKTIQIWGLPMIPVLCSRYCHHVRYITMLTGSINLFDKL